MGLDTWAGGCGVGTPDFSQKLNDDRFCYPLRVWGFTLKVMMSLWKAGGGLIRFALQEDILPASFCPWAHIRVCINTLSLITHSINKQTPNATEREHYLT